MLVPATGDCCCPATADFDLLSQMPTLVIPPVALGCGNFGGVGSAPEFFGQGLTDDQALELMDAAWDSGITHFDTADAYGGGRSERVIGRWISSRGVRPQLTTKTFNPMRAGADRGLAPERIGRQLDASLDRLGVGQVDLYLAHEFDADVPLGESFGAFEAAAARGAIRAYGVSNFDAAQLSAALAAGRPQAIQNSYSLLERQDSADLLPLCAAARDRLPGVQPAGRRLADRQVPPRRAVPGRVADDAASRAVPGLPGRTDLRRARPAGRASREPRDFDGRAGDRLAARRLAGDPGRDRPRASRRTWHRSARRWSIPSAARNGQR